MITLVASLPKSNEPTAVDTPALVNAPSIASPTSAPVNTAFVAATPVLTAPLDMLAAVSAESPASFKAVVKSDPIPDIFTPLVMPAVKAPLIAPSSNFPPCISLMVPPIKAPAPTEPIIPPPKAPANGPKRGPAIIPKTID